MPESRTTHVDLILDAEGLLLNGLDLVERLATDVRADPVIPWSFTGHLCQLRADTVEIDWEMNLWDVRQWLAGGRTGGPFVSNDQVWSCAAQCLVDIVSRIEDTVWRYEPFGSALALRRRHFVR